MGAHRDRLEGILNMQDCGHLVNAWGRGPIDVEAKVGITYLEGKVTQLAVIYV